MTSIIDKIRDNRLNSLGYVLKRKDTLRLEKEMYVEGKR